MIAFLFKWLCIMMLTVMVSVFIEAVSEKFSWSKLSKTFMDVGMLAFSFAMILGILLFACIVALIFFKVFTAVNVVVKVIIIVAIVVWLIYIQQD